MSRILSFLSYLVPPIIAPLVLLLRRKDFMALYHACQALSLFLGLLAVALVWLLIGWLIAFLSVEAPWIYMIPIVVAVAMPIWGMFKRSRVYVGRSIWWTIFWTTFLALAFSWVAWLVVQWLSPNVLPIAGPFLQMASFGVVMGALFVGVVGWVMGMVRALRAIAKPVPIFGGWGQRWFAATTRRAREALDVSDADALVSSGLGASGKAPLPVAASNATLSDEPILSPDEMPSDTPAGAASGVPSTGTLPADAQPADTR